MFVVRDGNDEKEFFVLLQNLFNKKSISLSLFTRACGRVNTDGDQYDDDDDDDDTAMPR